MTAGTRRSERGGVVSRPPSGWISRSAGETERAGAGLAKSLDAGDVIALSGPLGAGKSRLVAGVARGLGCPAPVRSPTFTLINQYSGRLTLFHADLYRVDPADVEGLGLSECLGLGALVVEWGEKLPQSLRAEALTLEIESLAENQRRFVALAGPAARGARLLEAWRAGVRAVSEDRP